MSKEFRFPDLGEGIAEGELIKWLVKVGDTVKEDQEVAEVETDKALVTIPSPMAGRVEKLFIKEGDRIKVGAVLMTFAESVEAPGPSPALRAPSPQRGEGKTENRKRESELLPSLATPFTRKLARELGVDLNGVKGSGPSGRITEEDVRAAAGKIPAGVSPLVPTPAPGPPLPELPAELLEHFEKYGPIQKIPIKGIRRKISEHMLVAARQAVMVTHIDEAEVDELLKIKKEKAKYAEARGVKLTLLPFLMKACVIALKNYPYLNASLVGTEIVLKQYYHFGFAVDSELGLIVPVVRDVDQKSIMRLATELELLSKKARERTISLEELRGHSFSISNIGSIGGKAFTPIIHYPDSAILGVGRTYEKPVAHEGKVKIAHCLPLCLTFDHRVTDGATAARFVNEVMKYLKDPDLLLLDDGEQ